MQNMSRDEKEKLFKKQQQLKINKQTWYAVLQR